MCKCTDLFLVGPVMRLAFILAMTTIHKLIASD